MDSHLITQSDQYFRKYIKKYYKKYSTEDKLTSKIVYLKIKHGQLRKKTLIKLKLSYKKPYFFKPHKYWRIYI